MKATIYFQPPRIEAILMRGAHRALPMFHSDVKVFRGVDNNIEFSLKDSDRQVFKALGKEIRCVILNPFNQQLMMTRYLVPENEQKGIYKLKITPGDIQEWSAGFYQYSLTLIDDDSTETMFYTAPDQEVTGKLELIEKPYPEFTPSKKITPEDWTTINFNNDTHPYSETSVTSRFAGDASKDYHDALQTFSALFDNFTGEFIIQGSLEENPGFLEDGWFNISVDPTSNADIMTFTNFSGIKVFNFVGNFVWIRFKKVVYEPGPTGDITKIWLKN